MAMEMLNNTPTRGIISIDQKHKVGWPHLPNNPPVPTNYLRPGHYRIVMTSRFLPILPRSQCTYPWILVILNFS
ncbi:hypothetical protein EYC84_003570 [Monilinia fructicola]|uniref:Uncharacterized protein n=1 Tax=Monilinia fructicola TaxID=38448 RepID=A0A5M9JXZ5_MONFR|nr:hypothetical protein EYC84_003570 [Monilinia fructicola]